VVLTAEKSTKQDTSRGFVQNQMSSSAADVSTIGNKSYLNVVFILSLEIFIEGYQSFETTESQNRFADTTPGSVTFINWLSTTKSTPTSKGTSNNLNIPLNSYKISDYSSTFLPYHSTIVPLNSVTKQLTTTSYNEVQGTENQYFYSFLSTIFSPS